jgi:hypothetical protein
MPPGTSPKSLTKYRNSRPPSRLLVSRIDYSILDGLSDAIKRIAVGWNFHAKPSLNPFFGTFGFALRLVVYKWISVGYAVSANFVPFLNHAFEASNIILAPVCLPPSFAKFKARVDIGWLSVGD